MTDQQGFAAPTLSSPTATSGSLSTPPSPPLSAPPVAPLAAPPADAVETTLEAAPTVPLVPPAQPSLNDTMEVPPTASSFAAPPVADPESSDPAPIEPQPSDEPDLEPVPADPGSPLVGPMLDEFSMSELLDVAPSDPASPLAGPVEFIAVDFAMPTAAPFDAPDAATVDTSTDMLIEITPLDDIDPEPPATPAPLSAPSPTLASPPTSGMPVNFALPIAPLAAPLDAPAPIADADVLAPPVTDAPAPIADADVLAPPVTDAPSAFTAPSTSPEPPPAAPTLDAPTLDAPALDAPTLDAPPPDAPTLDAPPLDAPTLDAPTAAAPTMAPPVVEAPPVAEAPPVVEARALPEPVVVPAPAVAPLLPPTRDVPAAPALLAPPSSEWSPAKKSKSRRTPNVGVKQIGTAVLLGALGVGGLFASQRLAVDDTPPAVPTPTIAIDDQPTLLPLSPDAATDSSSGIGIIDDANEVVAEINDNAEEAEALELLGFEPVGPFDSAPEALILDGDAIANGTASVSDAQSYSFSWSYPAGTSITAWVDASTGDFQMTTAANHVLRSVDGLLYEQAAPGGQWSLSPLQEFADRAFVGRDRVITTPSMLPEQMLAFATLSEIGDDGFGTYLIDDVAFHDENPQLRSDWLTIWGFDASVAPAAATEHNGVMPDVAGPGQILVHTEGGLDSVVTTATVSTPAGTSTYVLLEASRDERALAVPQLS